MTEDEKRFYRREAWKWRLWVLAILLVVTMIAEFVLVYQIKAVCPCAVPTEKPGAVYQQVDYCDPEKELDYGT